MKKYLSTYFTKLLLLCLVIGSIPIIVQTIFLYVKSSEIVQDKVQLSNASLLKQTQMNIEQRLKSIELIMLQFSNSSLVHRSMQTELTSKQFLLANDLFSTISTLQVFQNGVQNVFLINIAKNWILDTGVHTMEATRKEERYHQLLNNKSSSFWLLNDDYLPPHIGKDSSSKPVLLVQKIPILSNTPNGLVLVQMFSDELNQLLDNSSIQGTLLVLDEQHQVVAHSPNGQFQLDDNINSYIPWETIEHQADSSGYLELEISDNLMGVNYLKSSYNGWTYLSVIPFGEIKRETRSIGMLSMVFAMIILLLTAVLSYYGTKRLYTPVGQMMKKLTLGDPKARKKGNEFEAIMSKIGSILLDQRILDEKTNQHVKQLRYYFIHQLLKGDLTSSNIRQNKVQYGFTGDYERYSVAVVQIEDLEKTHYSTTDNALLMFAVQNIAEELLGNDSLFGSVLIDHYYAVIFKHESSSYELIKREIYGIAEKFQENVYKYLKLEISIGISRPYAAIDHSQLAYQEALEALKYQIQFGKRAVLYLQDLQPSEQNVVRYPIQQLQILSQAIKSGDTAKAQETVKEIIHELPRDNVMLQEYQFALLRIIIDILKIPADLGISIHYLVNKDNLDIDMLLKKNRGQLIAWINHECIVPVIEAIHLNRNAQRLRIIEEVQRIIHLEFDQNLTLESVAARLDIHPSYIRRLIKQETGSSFNQFLSDYRLEIAKQWLANTDMKIMEIADSLCYNNPQNFIRYFRRMTGITPGQYREVSSKLPEDFNPDLDRPEEN